jgi:hypothetical protein
MQTGFVRLLGGIVGGGLGFGAVMLARAGFDSSTGSGIAVLGVVVGVAVLFYVLASTLEGDWSETMRGVMIGMSAGGNAGVWAAWGVMPLAIGSGALLALALSNTISTTGVYQFVVGWANWVLPLSWLIVGLGMAFLAVSLVGWGFTFGQVDFFGVNKFFIDWSTGTAFLKGGFIANLNSYDTAFNMGNFAFIDTKSTADHAEHEAGHTLNLAAFGSLFHLIGFVDEVILSNKGDAYSERLADSHASSGGVNIPMWT